MPRRDVPSRGEPTPDEPLVVYLIGVAGHPNYGDELIAAGWLRYLAQVAPDAEVWLDTPRPGQSAVLLGGIHPGLRCVDTLFHACWNAPQGGARETLDHGRRVVREPGLLPREATGVEHLTRAQLVHVIGGGYLNRIWPSHLALLGAVREVGESFGARTAVTGAGLMPLVHGSGGPLGETLAGFDVVDVRDEESWAAISGAVVHATCSGDDAFLDLGPHVYDQVSGPRSVLCLQSDLLEIPLEEIADHAVRTLRSWGVDQEPVTLLECLPPDDAVVRRLLEPHLPQLDFQPFSELWRLGLPAGPDQRWISTRFHPHLVAAAGGSWGVAVPISRDYYRTKHASLLRLGSGWALAEDLTSPAPLQQPEGRPFGGRLGEIRKAKRAVAESVVGPLRRPEPAPAQRRRWGR